MKAIWWIVVVILALTLLSTTVLFIGSSINWNEKIGSHLEKAGVWAESTNISDKEVASELDVVISEVEATSWIQDVPAVKTWYLDLLNTRNALAGYAGDSLDSVSERSSVEFGYVESLAPEGMDIFPYRYHELVIWLFWISLIGLIICMCLIGEVFGLTVPNSGKVEEELA